MADRTLHGVNLSGWLVLESWVTPSIFSATGVFDEASLVEAMGHDRYAEVVRRHRDTFVTERDFQRIAARGLDAVRLPIPWYVFGEQGPMPGAYVGCLSYLDQAFDWAEAAGLQLLLDLAAIPGSSVGERGTLVEDTEKNRSCLLDVVAALAKRYADRTSFLGIEPLNAPVMQHRLGLGLTDGVPPHRLRNFYRDVYEVVRGIAGPRPIVVLSDGGVPGDWRRFMAQDRYENVWLDSHLYHYAESMGAAGPSGVRTLVAQSARSLKQADSSGLPIMVGEWSAALPLADSAMTPEGRMALERVYTSGQISAFAGTAGWFFRTWKTEGHLSSWDARIALASFEHGMFD
ncbi:MAG: cellulase family glycosylhydrolase [Atopobiaceae bacterium]|jgi:glucan 1,3-beta-glucosidase|nr:cellulase family glycosylhydrolase [Atopobiaceae bacterium]MCI2174236.1 cellulase family glycosylhydrolase [Atopobiaceae bacterium]MCI2206877.1 cellulase family glycosylhydrolase [Atopobiaceae bacterium]